MWFQDNVCSFDQAAGKIQHSSNPAKHGTVLTIFGSRPARLVIAKAGDFLFWVKTQTLNDSFEHICLGYGKLDSKVALY